VRRFIYGSVEGIPELDKLFVTENSKTKLKTVVLSARELKVVIVLNYII
jgi:hypothetical protein